MKPVVDINIIFSGIYHLRSNAGRFLLLGAEGACDLLSPVFVKEEIERVLADKLHYSEEEIFETVSALPVTWIEYEIYQESMDRAAGLIGDPEDVPKLRPV